MAGMDQSGSALKMEGTMRAFVGILTILLMAGCETTTRTTGIPASDISPITAPLTIGEFPVFSATQTATMTFTITQGFNSASIKTTMHSQLSVQHEGDEMLVTISLLKTDVSGRGYGPDVYAETAQEMKQLDGSTSVTHLNKRTGQVRVEFQGPELSAEEREIVENSGKLYRELIMSGKTLQQGQEIMTADILDLMGGEGLPDGSKGLITGRVLGQSLYHGRLVVVCNMVGGITLGQGAQSPKGSINGSFYIDAITGLPIYTRMEFIITGPDGEQLKMAGDGTTKL